MTEVGIRDLMWEVPGGLILRGVSLTAAPGSFIGIVGPNGSGKSSLLRCVYRMHRPQSGAVLLDGKDVWSLSARASAQMTATVLQEFPADFGLTVADVVALGRTPHQGVFARDGEVEQRLIADSLAQVGLGSCAGQAFDTLSGGEKQRALVARALVQQPKLLILDEPTNHLDIRYQRDILRLVKQLGITALASLHDLNQAAAYCDRLYVLHHGKIVAEGAPADILTSALIETVFDVKVRINSHPVTGRACILYEA